MTGNVVLYRCRIPCACVRWSVRVRGHTKDTPTATNFKSSYQTCIYPALHFPASQLVNEQVTKRASSAMSARSAGAHPRPRPRMFRVSHPVMSLSPRMRRASWMSRTMMVTRFPWMAHRLASSNRATKYASAISWRAIRASAFHLNSLLGAYSCVTSRTCTRGVQTNNNERVSLSWQAG